MSIHAAVGFTVAVAAVLTLQGERTSTQGAPIIDDPDAYAIYAAVLPLTSLIVDKPHTGIAILQETVAGGMYCRGEGVTARKWHSVVADYESKNARISIIRERFDLGMPYSLVSLAQLRKLMEDAGHLSPRSAQTNHLSATVFAWFPGEPLVALSAVGFSADKTLAVVTLQHDCFRSGEPRATCFSGHQMFLAKKDGSWALERLEWCWVA